MLHTREASRKEMICRIDDERCKSPKVKEDAEQDQPYWLIAGSSRRDPSVVLLVALAANRVFHSNLLSQYHGNDGYLRPSCPKGSTTLACSMHLNLYTHAIEGGQKSHVGSYIRYNAGYLSMLLSWNVYYSHFADMRFFASCLVLETG